LKVLELRISRIVIRRGDLVDAGHHQNSLLAGKLAAGHALAEYRSRWLVIGITDQKLKALFFTCTPQLLLLSFGYNFTNYTTISDERTVYVSSRNDFDSTPF